MKDNMELREMYYVSYKDEKTNKSGLRDKETNEIIIEASKENGFTSLVPSRDNTLYCLPIVATYNKYDNNGDIIKGIIEVKGNNGFVEINLPDSYNFIDGFEGGLARVYKMIDGKKKWGIIGLRKIGDKVEIREVVAPLYDNLSNFYNKFMTSIQTTKNGVTKDISLNALKEKLKSMRQSIIAISEDALKAFSDSNKYKKRYIYDVQIMHEAFDYLFVNELPVVVPNLGTKNKVNLLVRLTARQKTFLMSDLSNFYEQLNSHHYVGELIWGVDIVSEQKSRFHIEVIAGWNDLEVEFSDDGMQVKLKGIDYEAISSVKINDVQYSVGHAQGKMYDFGVIDHTNKRIILPFVFNHIAIGLQTQPLIVSANYQGRWYVLKPQKEVFKIENIESASIVDSRRYTLIDGYDHGVARVRINESWGIINSDGKEVLPVEYQNIWNFYGKNRVYTNVEKNGRQQPVFFRFLAMADSTTEEEKSDQLPYMPKLNSVGMKNFKRFKDHVDIQLRDINFFVGPNNAGKSTAIKALILLVYNLRKLRLVFGQAMRKDGAFEKGITIPFDFAPHEFPYLNTNSYLLCVNRFGKELSIKLGMSLGQLDFEVSVDKSSSIEFLTIVSRSSNLKIVIYENFVRLISDKVLLREYHIRENNEIGTQLQGVELLSAIIDGFTKFEHKDDKEIAGKLNEFKTELQDSINHFGSVYHIPIYSASRQAVLNRYDSNDLTAKAATSYLDMPYMKKKFARDFMLRWMGQDHFKMGTDFKIETIKGRNTLLTIEIKDVDGAWIDLCDMGTGANHLFVLLLSIACLISDYASRPFIRQIIIIEEPEMNLHPKYQSMITEMLEDANRYTRELAHKLFSKYYNISDEQIENLGFQFVVETHSEYLVRKSQVIVANKNYESESYLKAHNTFNVIYFNDNCNDEILYELVYETTGGFKRKFGTGFFDEAANLDMVIIQKEKDLANKINSSSDIEGLLNMIK